MGKKGEPSKTIATGRPNSSEQLSPSRAETNEQFDKEGDTTMSGTGESPADSHDQPTRYTLQQREAITRIRQCDEHDYYGILGLRKRCSAVEIRKKYRALAILTHPDQNKFDDAEIAFKRLGTAYDVLRNPSQRKEYDAGGRYSPQVACDPHEVFGEEFAKNAAGPDSGDSGPSDDDDSGDDSDESPDEEVTAIYEKATPLVNQLLAEADTPARKRLQSGLRRLNKSIEEVNRKAGRSDRSLLIKIDLLVGFCIEYTRAVKQLQEDPTNVPAMSSIRRIQKQFRNAMKCHYYPAAWQLPTAAGVEEQGCRIIGHVPHKDPSRIRFLMEKPGDPCGLMFGYDYEVGVDQANEYMQLSDQEQKDIRYSDSRYNRALAHKYKRILGWTNKLGKTPLEFRQALPTGYGLIEFHDGTTDILTRTAVRKLLGQRKADQEIDKFYRDRQIVPPWAYMPNVRRLEGPRRARIEGHAPTAAYPPRVDIRTAPSRGVSDGSIRSENGLEHMTKIMEQQQSELQDLVKVVANLVSQLHLSTKIP